MDVLEGDDHRRNFIEFQSRVRKHLLELADETGGIIIDATKPQEEQHMELVRHISELIVS